MQVQRAVENAELSDLDLYLLYDPRAVEEAIILQNLTPKHWPEAGGFAGRGYVLPVSL